MRVLILLACLLLSPLRAQDPTCPAYPVSARTELANSLARDRAWKVWHQHPHQAAAISLKRNNFIDDKLFAAMEADGVTPAALSSDAEFLRRVSLDLTGRIPLPDSTMAFLADSTPDKRARLIDTLLASNDYIDQWTFYFMDRFQTTESFIQIGRPGNRVFYNFVRDFVKRDRSYQDFVRDTITASGDNYLSPIQFLSRQLIDGGVAQDTWDAIADASTTQFLGVTTQCISCHNGRGYLDKVNLYLSGKQRAEFWQLAAFFARTNLQQINTDVNGGASAYIVDSDTGLYNGFVNVSNPGIRPPRPAASYSPAYLFNGETPNGPWRSELARMLTTDRQFARAAVNYIWAAMFGYGIVDPPNAWDLRRIDPANPPPDPWPLQNSQPALLEALTDRFISSGYSIKTLVRLIANSTAYQLSSDYTGTWQPAFTRYFARRLPRRLTAEKIFDSVTRATQTETPFYIEDFDHVVYYANQFPDVFEPRFDPRAQNFLALLGRGVWYGSPARTPRPSLLGALFMLNSDPVMSRTLAQSPGGGVVAQNRAERLGADTLTDEAVVTQLYLATLVRNPTAAELQTAIAAKTGTTRLTWIGYLQWALLNKLEFLFY